MDRKINLHSLTEQENAAFELYLKRQPNLLNNKVIIGFFQNPGYLKVFIRHLMKPDDLTRSELKITFQKYFFTIRFTKYLSSLIKFACIDFHRARLKHKDRHLLVFDTPFDEDGDLSLGEYILNNKPPSTSSTSLYNVETFVSSIENNLLFQAFASLTPRQQEVLTLFYAARFLDSEIAKSFHVSQQAITKSRILAIQKMRSYFQKMQ